MGIYFVLSSLATVGSATERRDQNVELKNDTCTNCR